jgi:hypothetical protein
MASLTKKQLKIASQTPPLDTITRSDFKALQKGNDISKNMFVKNNGNSKKNT